jgi:hypothetical protein
MSRTRRQQKRAYEQLMAGEIPRSGVAGVGTKAQAKAQATSAAVAAATGLSATLAASPLGAAHTRRRIMAGGVHEEVSEYGAAVFATHRKAAGGRGGGDGTRTGGRSAIGGVGGHLPPVESRAALRAEEEALQEFMMEDPPDVEAKSAALLHPRVVSWEKDDPHRPTTEERHVESRIRRKVHERARVNYQRALRREQAAEREALALEEREHELFELSGPRARLSDDGETAQREQEEEREQEELMSGGPLNAEELAALRERCGVRANAIAAEHAPKDFIHVDEEDRLIVDGVVVPQNLAHHFIQGPEEFV